jgi:cholecystokinin-like receptor
MDLIAVDLEKQSNGTNSQLITNFTEINSNTTIETNETIGVLISNEQIFTLILPYSIIFLLAIIGNALVIITLSANRRMRSVTNIFLLNLAVSDLLLGVFCMPFTLVGVLLKEFVFGSLMCRLISYLQGL